MRFPTTFLRYVGTPPAGGVALGGDGDPNGELHKDNVFELQLRIDRPANRLVIGYLSNATSPKTLTADVWIYGFYGTVASGSAAWFKITGSAVPLTPNVLSYVGIPGNQPPATNQDPSLLYYVQVHAAGSDPDGTYTFVVSADVGTGGGISQGL